MEIGFSGKDRGMADRFIRIVCVVVVTRSQLGSFTVLILLMALHHQGVIVLEVSRRGGRLKGNARDPPLSICVGFLAHFTPKTLHHLSPPFLHLNCRMSKITSKVPKMSLTRGGWLGQTFALAKFDDSFEGKKSGIRRSKEERKGMVETFIKRYQKLNNGDFPSLNLTRKEVGGSFYTVREIVREIIQENRVLGPPKSPPGDKNMENLDSFLEHHPLGSMSVDHHVRVAPPKDAQPQLEYEFGSEQVPKTKSIPKLYQGNIDSGNVVDGSMNKTERNEEANDPIFTELLVERGEEEHKVDEVIYAETSLISEGDIIETTHAAVKNDNVEEQIHIEKMTHVTANNGSVEKMKNTELLVEGGVGEHVDEVSELVANQTQKHQLLEDVEVGTSSLGPVTSTIHKLDEKLSEREILYGGLEEKDAENRKLATENNEHLVCNEMHLFDKSTDVVDMKLEEEITHPLSESKPPLASQKAQNDLSTKENVVLHGNDKSDIEFEDTLPAEEKTISIMCASASYQTINGANAHNLDSKTSSISVQQSTLDERSADLNKSRDQPGDNPQKRTGATLNRINLSESWKAASKKPSGRETHQLVAFIRAFITAFF
ncbi:hypothetical protein OSB04_017804 [Centaurea solstitialis]|uniref:AT3G52170-like helix-turn-helix domain-containing protein n=1 Tax=Centaurea solstitialis TaxID=347529 RepID=A0AA38WL34_9ASTR|nr:hypothetical protein OSB04_017804 [Centaurea solstitialis]